MDPFVFTGHTVLVTGAAKRIGAAVCRAFASQGANVIIHARNSRTEAENLAAEIGAELVFADFAIPGEAENLFSQLTRPVDILINNASLYRHGDNSDDPLYEEVNFFAPQILMQKFAEQCPPQGGCIINFGDSATTDLNNLSGYARSRRRLAEESRRLAREWAARNIRINTVNVGPTLPPPELGSTGMKKTPATLPLARAVALDDLVTTVLFLAKNASITGAVLPVDCGLALTIPPPR